MDEQDTRERFTRCWHEDVGRVRAYALRHVGPDDAAEVVSETFLAAWRRWDDVPDPPLPWLIGTARKTIGNHRRGGRRREDLSTRLTRLEAVATSGPGADVEAGERLAALQVLTAMPDRDREALLLVAWDGLDPAQAAEALGVRPATLRVRLHRARRRLDAALDDSTTTDRHATTEELSWRTT